MFKDQLYGYSIQFRLILECYITNILLLLDLISPLILYETSVIQTESHSQHVHMMGVSPVLISIEMNPVQTLSAMYIHICNKPKTILIFKLQMEL